MKKPLKRLLNELEYFGKKNYGYFNISADTGKFFYNLIVLSKAKNILEIGTSNGYSTIWLGEAAKINQGKVTTIEISEHKVKEAADNFKRAKLNGIIKIIQGDALKEIPRLNSKFDFLFLDAIKKDYINYLKLAWPKLAKNAVIVADNAIIFRDEMREYLEHVRCNKNLSSVLIPVGTGVEFSVKLK